jgi:pimeloyl-ACP methyl ester carboxylesterase
MGDSLVLIPGLLCDAALWEPQIEALGDVAACWVADVTRDETMRALAARVLSEAPPGRFALAGLSMGGYVALEVMRQAPERVERLALLDTSARPDTPERTQQREAFIALARRERGFAPITRVMLPLMIHPTRLQDEPLVRAIRDMADRVGIEGYVRQQKAIISRPDSRPSLPAIACPTLVLCGREDALTPLEGHEEIARLVRGASLVIVERCGHMSTMERPAEVAAAMRAWLGQ